MIFAMSDIHGDYEQLCQRMTQLENIKSFAQGKDTLILLGDYLDGGKHSYQALNLIWNLPQTQKSNIIVLRGNHEDAFLEFIDGEDIWLADDKDLNTVKTFLIPKELEQVKALGEGGRVSEVSGYIRSCIKARHAPLLRWMKTLPYYYETNKQIFVHAGIDEEAEDMWKWGTADYYFTGKFPPTTGQFYKDIIAGHTSAISVSGNPSHKGIYWDGGSHYFIDGGAERGGSLLCLVYDEKKDKYYELLPAEQTSPAQDATGGTLCSGLMPL